MIGAALLASFLLALFRSIVFMLSVGALHSHYEVIPPISFAVSVLLVVAAGALLHPSHVEVD